MSGGTGGGTIIDIAQAVRSICQQFSQEVAIHGVLGSTYHPESNDSLAAANMYSLLTELNHAQIKGNCGESPPTGPASRYELPQRPLDEIYTVPIPIRSDRSACHLALQSIADYCLLESSGSVRPAMKAIRLTTPEGVAQGSLHTFSCVNVGQLANVLTTIQQQQLLKTIVEYWLKEHSESMDGDAKLFYPHANSQFAHAILSCFPDMPIVSDPTTEISALAGEASANRKAIRTAKIKHIAEAFLQFIDSIELRYDNSQPQLDSSAVESACDQIVANLFLIIQRAGLQENKLSQKLSELVDDQLAELIKKDSAANRTELATSALSLLDVGPLNCGYRRRTLLVSQHDQADTELFQAFSEACPTLAGYKAAVAKTYLIREGSHLQPLQLGARLAELYPDIDEAAGRLHARDDIKWRDLRCT
jgi:hypothetical protein